MQAPEPITRNIDSATEQMAAAYAAAEQGDYARALEIWGPLAPAGVTRAQSNIGACFANGLGVAPDRALALRWLTLAAEAGDAVGQRNLATLYFKGELVELDAAAAARWYRAASEQGDAESQDMLSWLLVEAELLPPNYEEARRWALAAAEQGVATAMTRLGMLYHNALGVARDPSLPRNGGARRRHWAIRTGRRCWAPRITWVPVSRAMRWRRSLGCCVRSMAAASWPRRSCRRCAPPARPRSGAKQNSALDCHFQRRARHDRRHRGPHRSRQDRVGARADRRRRRPPTRRKGARNHPRSRLRLLAAPDGQIVASSTSRATRSWCTTCCRRDQHRSRALVVAAVAASCRRPASISPSGHSACRGTL